MAAAALSGFSGLVLEPSGYQSPESALRAALRSELGAEPIVSRDGELWFFDLRGYAAALRRRLGASASGEIRAATLDPIRVGCSKGGLTLTGGSAAQPVTATLSAELPALEPAYGTLSTRLDEGPAEPLEQAGGTAVLSRPVLLKGGSSTVRFLATGPVPARGVIDVTAATLTARAYQPLISSAPARILAGYPSPPCQVHPGPSPQPPALLP